jgi:precorrin-3B synthase
VSTQRSVPDACPGIVAVHRADDGGLVRVRLPGGLLTGAQLAGLAEASVELGDGNLDLTSRANLQIRGLRDGTAEELSQRLYVAGLLPSVRHDRVRNIVASPLSGLDERSPYDVMPLAGELDRRLCATDRLAELPGRFLFVLDDGRGDVAALAPDAAIQVVGPTSAALLLAGTDTGVRIDPATAVDVLIAAAEAFLTERERDGSTAWRLAELPSAIPRILQALPIPGFQDAGSSRLEAGRSLPGLVTSGPPEPGVHGGGGQRVVVATVPLGRMTYVQARLLADTVGADGEIRITPWRSVVLPDAISGGAGREVAARLAEGGLVVDPGSAWVGVTACTGRPGCGKALADVRTDAVRVVGATDGPQAVHWSGCERRCGRPKGQIVDVVAIGNGYAVDGVGVRTVDEVAALIHEAGR